jgi:hypothetical protein
MKNADELITRAESAYFVKTMEAARIPVQPLRYVCRVEEHDQKECVVLRNLYRVLAVYSLLADGNLRWLVRWPKRIRLEKSALQAMYELEAMSGPEMRDKLIEAVRLTGAEEEIAELMSAPVEEIKEMVIRQLKVALGLSIGKNQSLGCATDHGRPS